MSNVLKQTTREQALKQASILVKATATSLTNANITTKQAPQFQFNFSQPAQPLPTTQQKPPSFNFNTPASSSFTFIPSNTSSATAPPQTAGSVPLFASPNNAIPTQKIQKEEKTRVLEIRNFITNKSLLDYEILDNIKALVIQWPFEAVKLHRQSDRVFIEFNTNDTRMAAQNVLNNMKIGNTTIVAGPYSYERYLKHDFD